MPNAYYKGNFVIKHSAGTTKLAGLAVLTNSAASAGWRDVTEVMEHKDALGVPRSLTKDYNCFELTYRIVPGIGELLASTAAAATAISAVKRGDAFISTLFTQSDLNCAAGDKAIVWEIGGQSAEGQLAGVDVTVRKWTDTAGAAIDFTAAWATL